MQEEIDAIIELQNLKDGYTPAVRDILDELSDINTKLDKLVENK